MEQVDDLLRVFFRRKRNCHLVAVEGLHHQDGGNYITTDLEQ